MKAVRPGQQPSTTPLRAPAEAFRRVLSCTAKEPHTPRPAVITSRPLVRVTVGVRVEALTTTRVEAHTEAKRLAAVREHHHATADQQTHRRADDVDVGSALEHALRPHVEAALAEVAPTPKVAPSVGAQPDAPQTNATAPSLVTPASRALQAVQLIEKIDFFVKSQRPAMRLGLMKSLGAEVEIERVGPKTVALRVTSSGGPPPSTQLLKELRSALAQRGLTVKRLTLE